jgi:subtilisin-like proprotein convertase family protein
MQGFTPESTYIPANATTYVPYTLEDAMPNGALIDSVFVTTDFEPDGEYENFRVWVVTPGGTEVLIYDGLNGEPDVDDLQIPAAKGETAKGDWRLKVARGASTIERWAEECELEIHYRY